MSTPTEREALIATIVANSDLSEDVLQDDETYSLCALKALNAAYEPAEEPEPEPEPKKQNAQEPIDFKPKLEKDDVLNALGVDAEKFNQAMASVEQRQQQESAEKAQLIEALVQNQVTGLSEAELQQESVKTLQAFQRMSQPTNYGVTPGATKQNAFQAPAPPKVLTAKGEE